MLVEQLFYLFCGIAVFGDSLQYLIGLFNPELGRHNIEHQLVILFIDGFEEFEINVVEVLILLENLITKFVLEIDVSQAVYLLASISMQGV